MLSAEAMLWKLGRAAVTAAVLASCTWQPAASDAPASSAPGEARARRSDAFESHEAVLVDFELDGKLITKETISDSEPLIVAQLMYALGNLNADRSGPRYERLELSNILISFFADHTEVTYHAKLPVAWAGGASPSRYALTLPLRIGGSEAADFASKYAATCADPSGGAVDGHRMFLFFRPKREGCRLDPADVLTVDARVRPSAANTSAKYPEYHRIWEDGALDVVAVFGVEHDGGGAADTGAVAFRHFVRKAEAHLRALDGARVEVSAAPEPVTIGHVTRLSAALPDGRQVRVESRLVEPHLAERRSAFDEWYDARTPSADAIIYSGHAGLGANVRALMNKGAFVANKYLVFVVNGCDTFAYVDPTLARRRAVLNPTDPGGTKLMDTVTNVLGGYFSAGDETSLKLLRDLLDGGDPKLPPRTYEQIFDGIDPEQVIVVTGEEDNEFQPGMLRRPPSEAGAAVPVTDEVATPVGWGAGEPEEASSPAAGEADDGGCNAAARKGSKESSALLALAGMLAMGARRRRWRQRQCKEA